MNLLFLCIMKLLYIYFLLWGILFSKAFECSYSTVIGILKQGIFGSSVDGKNLPSPVRTNFVQLI